MHTKFNTQQQKGTQITNLQGCSEWKTWGIVNCTGGEISIYATVVDEVDGKLVPPEE
jgi:hypothetical protein